MTWRPWLGGCRGWLQGSSISGEVTYLSVLMWTQASSSGWVG